MRAYHDQGRIGEKEISEIISMDNKKKFAVPTVHKTLTPHFGHCEQFALIETENGDIMSMDFVDPPMHQPGIYPAFLASQGVNVIISGGMGRKAQDLFAQNNIEVCTGVTGGAPEHLVRQYLQNSLRTGQNLCDH